jgi:enoyl-CoA hydratase/carnithine racemase
MPGTITVEQRGRVLVATLANPPHGLMDRAMVEALAGVVARAEEDQEVGGVVLTGAHPERFVAHYDVAELLAGAEASPAVSPGALKVSLRAVGGLRRVPGGEEALERTPAGGLAQLERFHELFLRMNRCGAVFVAALNGSAMGGGSELALACDVRLMARGDHGIGQPEILLAFPPGGGGTQRLARLLGPGKALRVVLDGGPLTPEQAVELGLVDRVVEPEALVDQAVAEAGRLGSRVKAAVAASKRAVYEGGSMTLAAGLRLERAEFMSALVSAEAREAMRAYVEAIERTGELPVYDRERLGAALGHGRFA